MLHPFKLCLVLLFAFLFVTSVGRLHAQTTNAQKTPRGVNAPKVDGDFDYQGEYLGNLNLDGTPGRFGLQVIAMGKGNFKAFLYRGGLPGAGSPVGREQVERTEWDAPGKFEPLGSIDPFTGRKGLVQFQGSKHGDGVIQDRTFTLMNRRGMIAGQLQKVDRKSPSLGAKPPGSAVILFDGKSADGWKNGKITDDGLLMQGTTSERMFDDFRLHLEFRLPYMPAQSGQGRGNSGIYVQGRWEIQMLDSFGLTGEQNECGGIYSVGKPDVNMCLPPLSWQTYDIDFTSAKYDTDKQLKSNARMTVWHNGVKIHDNLELPDRKTTAAPVNVGPTPGPIFLQDHGNPVRYRNIWLIEK